MLTTAMTIRATMAMRCIEELLWIAFVMSLSDEARVRSWQERRHAAMAGIEGDRECRRAMPDVQARDIVEPVVKPREDARLRHFILHRAQLPPLGGEHVLEHARSGARGARVLRRVRRVWRLWQYGNNR